MVFGPEFVKTWLIRICSLFFFLSTLFILYLTILARDSGYQLQYLQRNYESQSTYFYSASLQDIIEENKNLLSRDDHGNIKLVSNFGENEYKCLGTCYCENSERQTSSTVISKRILSYIFLSISSVLAFEKAKSNFDSECSKQLSEECHQSSIKSSVDECKLMTEEEDRIYRKYFGFGEDEEKRVFFCYGNCVRNLNHHSESTRKQFRHFQCEKLKQEGDVVLYESELISKKFRVSALVRFQELYLKEFCRKNSEMKYYNTEGRIRNSGYGCVGRSKGMGLLNNVRCLQVYPKPKTNSYKWNLDTFNARKKEWDEV